MLIGCSTPPQPPTASREAVIRADIERRIEEIFSAAERKEMAELDSYHAYGPGFSKFAMSSPGRLDSAAAREGEHAGLAPLESLEMRAEDLRIDLFGEVAIATFILESEFVMAGRVHHQRDRSTLVFVYQDSAWKITHEHFSPIPPIR